MVKKLNLSEKIELIKLATDDFNKYVSWGRETCPSIQKYTISTQANPDLSELRINAFKKLTNYSPLTKLAFDTRRINQQTQQNPRRNLQNWQRSEPFVSKSDELRLGKFTKIFKTVTALKDQLEGQSEWFDSYTRLLYNTLDRTLKKKQGTIEVHPPQLSYLEQLLQNRYGINLNDIDKFSNSELEERILVKDSNLQAKATFLRVHGNLNHKIKSFSEEVDPNNNSFVKTLVEKLIKTQDDDKAVERTITITIRDREI